MLCAASLHCCALCQNLHCSLQAFPDYTDCHMRLACIEHARGDSDAALAWMHKALERKPSLADARALLGGALSQLLSWPLHACGGATAPARMQSLLICCIPHQLHCLCTMFPICVIKLIKSSRHTLLWRTGSQAAGCKGHISLKGRLMHTIIEQSSLQVKRAQRGPMGVCTTACAGWLRLERREFKEAEEVFVALTREPGTKNDPYAWLGLATLNLMSAPSDRKRVCASLGSLASI